MEFLGNFLGIYEKFWGEFLGKFLGIFWEFFRNFPLFFRRNFLGVILKIFFHFLDNFLGFFFLQESPPPVPWNAELALPGIASDFPGPAPAPGASAAAAPCPAGSDPALPGFPGSSPSAGKPAGKTPKFPKLPVGFSQKIRRIPGKLSSDSQQTSSWSFPRFCWNFSASASRSWAIFWESVSSRRDFSWNSSSWDRSEARELWDSAVICSSWKTGILGLGILWDGAQTGIWVEIPAFHEKS